MPPLTHPLAVPPHCLHLQRATVPPACREYALTALAKLEPRLPGSAERIKASVAAFRQSSQLEVQTRSVEYSRLFNYGAIGPQVRWGDGWAGGRWGG